MTDGLSFCNDILQIQFDQGQNIHASYLVQEAYKVIVKENEQIRIIWSEGVSRGRAQTRLHDFFDQFKFSTVFYRVYRNDTYQHVGVLTAFSRAVNYFHIFEIVSCLKNKMLHLIVQRKTREILKPILW